MSTTFLKTIRKSILTNIKKEVNHVKFSSKYKAAIVASESSDSLQIEERERPKLKADEVRIKVRYFTVNASDIHNFKNPAHGFPFIPGYEFAGDVLEVGKDVTKENVIQGEQVAALTLGKFGAFSEECVVNVKDVFRLPGNVQPKDAATIILSHSLAMFAFSRVRELKKTDYVLVTAGASGLGLAAIDVAANVYGTKVIGVVDSAERADMARSTGAFATAILSPKLAKQVKDMTKQHKGVDVIYDAVGEANVGECITYGGSVFHVASTMLLKTIPTPRPNCNLMILSLLALRQHDVELYRTVVNDTLELADAGSLTPVISAKYSFNKEDLNKAIQFAGEMKTTGKILIKI